MEKYFQPKITDLYIGYACEIQTWDEETNDTWIPYTINFEYGWLEIPEDYNKKLRTPYLSKEDIESCGFKYIEKSIDIWFEKEGTFERTS